MHPAKAETHYERKTFVMAQDLLEGWSVVASLALSNPHADGAMVVLAMAMKVRHSLVGKLENERRKQANCLLAGGLIDRF
jgi:hypothetical protein